jgi:hypothetical protein
MSTPIHLFVSSSPELYVEREIIGQVVAKLPLTIGWRIDHTPLPGELGSDSVAQVAQCDLYVIVLGQDFAAPMGAELRQAIAIDKSPLAYRKKCAHSPSSQDVIRRLHIEWRVFSFPDYLRTVFTRDVLQAVVRRAIEFGLDLDELERLLELARQADRELGAEGGAGRQRGDAGRSSVILGREVWETGRRER